MDKKMLGLAAGLVAAPAAAQAPPHPGFDVSQARAAIAPILAKAYPHLEAIYKDIHEHPELGFQESRTAELLAKEMRKLGFTVTTGVGKTGIVAIYKNGDGPTILVRTELDALPMEEKTGLIYASKVQQQSNGSLSYVAHSCGHDAHMAWWLGTATTLVGMKDQWKGTLMFVGQPAEELGTGAKAMIEDGLFTRWAKPDYAFAAHVMPLPAGLVIVKDGIVSSASDAVDITFNGAGAHGSMPDKSIDPIMMGSRFVTDVQSVVSREKDPKAFGVITVGSFVAGTVGNIIPDHADLKLTLRSHDEKTRALLLEGVERTARTVSDMARAPAPTITHQGGTAAVINTSDLAQRTAAMLKTGFGAESIFVSASEPGGNASEDYSELVKTGIPSVFFAIGGLDPARRKRTRPKFRSITRPNSPRCPSRPSNAEPRRWRSRSCWRWQPTRERTNVVIGNIEPDGRLRFVANGR